MRALPALLPALLLAACESGTRISERAEQMAVTEGLHARVVSKADLPPEGTRSLFDHLIAQNDGLPYPFEKLLALVQAQDVAAQPPLALMIPLGRSLLKAQADFAHPRVLAAADFHAANPPGALGIAPRGQLFMGFVENAAEIEVISYNELAGRFEFQLVQDYREGGVPRIVYARRAVCLTCHQGAAPIFPQRPWNETNGQPEISERIAQARGTAPYLGVPALNPLGVPERYDELTDVANFIPVTQRLWIEGCGETGTDCRRQMLKLALQYLWSPAEFDAASGDAQALRALQQQSWPAAGIPVPEPDIRNRDPLAETRGWRGYWRALFAPDVSEPGARSNEDLSAFERLPKLPSALDPLTPRPPRRALTAQDIDGAYGLAALFTADDVRGLEAAAQFDLARLLAAVDRLPSERLGAAPFVRVHLLQALHAALGTPSLTDHGWLSTAQMSPPQALGVPPLEIAEGSPLLAYERYCFACHRGNPAARLSFMDGDSEAEVLARIRETASIRDALDWERYKGTDKASLLMPPADSHQRQLMEQALREEPALLEQMREQVPGLFDF